MDAHEENLINKSEDTEMESVLLRRILELHPIRVTADEIVRDLAGEDPDFATRDSIERAIRELTGAGLLHGARDVLITPSRAAILSGDLLVR